MNWLGFFFFLVIVINKEKVHIFKWWQVTTVFMRTQQINQYIFLKILTENT